MIQSEVFNERSRGQSSCLVQKKRGMKRNTPLISFNLNVISNEKEIQNLKKSSNTFDVSKKVSFNSPYYNLPESEGKIHRHTMTATKLLNKRKSSVSPFSSHKMSFLSEIDEIKKAKTKLSILDSYSEEQLINTAITILQKPKNYRTNLDIKMLVKSTERINFFAEMINNNEKEKHEECCKFMTYSNYQKGDIVFHEGSIANEFYVILKGSVGVFKREILLADLKFEKMDSAKINPEEKYKSKNSYKLKKSFSSKNIKETKENSPPKNLETKIKVLKSGESFGELAFIDHKPRAATIICEEECHFGILEKSSFDKILKDFKIKKLYEQIEFFASLSLFKSWSYNAVKNIYLLTTQCEYLKDAYVYKENDLLTDVYIVKSGEFKILKQIDIDDDISDIESNYLFDTGRSSNKNKKLFEIAILGPGESFGEEELIKNTPRKNSVICSCLKGSLYILDKKEFIKKVYQNKSANFYLNDHINQKRKFFDKRIEEIFSIEKEKLKNKKKDSNYENQYNGINDEFSLFPIRRSNLKNIITNKKKKSINISHIIKELSKNREITEKEKVVPIGENIMNPIDLIKILKDKNCIKKLPRNFPKKNLYILSNWMKTEKSPLYKNQRHTRFATVQSPQSKANIILTDNDSIETSPLNSNIRKSTEKKLKKVKEQIKLNLNERKPSFTMNINLPLNKNSIVEFFKEKTYHDELNSYRGCITSRSEKRKNVTCSEYHKKNRIKFNNDEYLQMFDQQGIFNKINFDYKRRYSELNLRDETIKFNLPLKYSSSELKRNALNSNSYRRKVGEILYTENL